MLQRILLQSDLPTGKMGISSTILSNPHLSKIFRPKMTGVLDPMLMDADVIAQGKAEIAKIIRDGRCGIFDDLIRAWNCAYRDFASQNVSRKIDLDRYTVAFQKLHLAQYMLFGSLQDAFSHQETIPLPLPPPFIDAVDEREEEGGSREEEEGEKEEEPLLRLATAEQIANSGALDGGAVEIFARGDAVGNGVRATKSIPPGKKVASYGGALLPMGALCNSHYLIYLNGQVKVDGDPSLQESRGHLGPFFNDAQGLIRLGKNNARFSYGYIYVDGRKVRTIWIVTVRAIAPQEEIFVSYGKAFWNGRQ